jgi:hypothetical protein
VAPAPFFLSYRVTVICASRKLWSGIAMYKTHYTHTHTHTHTHIHTHICVCIYMNELICTYILICSTTIYNHPWISPREWFQEALLDTKIYKLLRLYGLLHIICLCSPLYFKSSLDYLQCLIKYKCYVNNCYTILFPVDS